MRLIDSGFKADENDYIYMQLYNERGEKSEYVMTPTLFVQMKWQMAKLAKEMEKRSN